MKVGDVVGYNDSAIKALDVIPGDKFTIMDIMKRNSEPDLLTIQNVDDKYGCTKEHIDSGWMYVVLPQLKSRWVNISEFTTYGSNDDDKLFIGVDMANGNETITFGTMSSSGVIEITGIIQKTNGIPICPKCKVGTERKLGSRFTALAYYMPVYDEEGNITNYNANEVTIEYLCVACGTTYKVKGDKYVE